MKRGKPLRRTAFRRQRAEGPTAAREPKPWAAPTVKPLRVGVYAGGTSGAAVAKDEPARSEAYRRLVAMLPCKYCGTVYGCQAAHPNAGKGMAIKADDRGCFSLCHTCHRLFDQAALFTKEVRRALEEQWGRETRTEIASSGMWPARLPAWIET